MSDIAMAPDRITIRISVALGKRLRQRSRKQGVAESELVREALEKYLGAPAGKRSAYELAVEAGLVGSVEIAPRDLSTNQDYFEGFGRK